MRSSTSTDGSPASERNCSATLPSRGAARGEGQAAADLQVVPITPQTSQPVRQVLGDDSVATLVDVNY